MYSYLGQASILKRHSTRPHSHVCLVKCSSKSNSHSPNQPNAIMAQSQSIQPPSFPGVPDRSVSLQCPAAEFPNSAQEGISFQCHSAQPQFPCQTTVSLHCPIAEYPSIAQLQSIPAVPNQCLTEESIPAVPHRRVIGIAQPQCIPAVPNCRVCLQCPTAEHPDIAQPQSIPAVPKHGVSLQCPTAECPGIAQTAEYPCSTQPQSVPAAPKRRVSRQCPTAECACSAQPQSVLAKPNRSPSMMSHASKKPRLCEDWIFHSHALRLGWALQGHSALPGYSAFRRSV